MEWVFIVALLVLGFVAGYEVARRKFDVPSPPPEAQARVEFHIGPISEQR